MSESASIVLTKSGGFRAEIRLSGIPPGDRLADSDCRLMADLVSLISGALTPGLGERDVAEIRKQVEDRAARTVSPIRVEFEAGWHRERAMEVGRG